jgi:phosphatidylserine decarboxylase
MSVGHHPRENQHTPDMRKKDEDITESEKAEARRRIDGSISGQLPHGLSSRTTQASIAG